MQIGHDLAATGLGLRRAQEYTVHQDNDDNYENGTAVGHSMLKSGALR